ncbi:MAG: enoyl-CoA hydratase/isomerase family protein [Xanthomonadales bacterium]|nr:enoyl-CoA hydratase/isomerase family protein [Xanthomonadales bacterium]MCB1633938.1 enoyl-CoA hydratase/isomerase family protein [Xanthomonadales bacterium]
MRQTHGYTLEQRDDVAWLWLDRPDLHNAFDDALIAALTVELEELAKLPQLRALVLAGRGSSFSAGADLNWMRRMAAAGREANRDDALGLATLMRTLAFFPRPTLARVHGAAYGGGVGLIACCDIALAADSARFGLTEVRLGLVPAVISPYVVEAIGARQARRWFLTGESFDATQAQSMGLVHRVLPATELDGAVAQQLKLILRAGPAACSVAKQLVFGIRGTDEARQGKMDAHTADLIASLRVSPEGQEGITAFLEKRSPSWEPASTES